MLDTDVRFPAETTLRGEGFALRPLCAEDAPDVALAGADELIQRWLPLPRPYTMETARTFIDGFARDLQRSGSGLVQAIEVEDRLAGCIDLKKTDWPVVST